MRNRYVEAWLFSPSNWNLHGISTFSAALLRLFSSLLFSVCLLSVYGDTAPIWILLAFLIAIGTLFAFFALAYKRLFAALVVVSSIYLIFQSASYTLSLCWAAWAIWGIYQLILCIQAPSYPQQQRVRSHSLNPDWYYAIKIAIACWIWIAAAFLPVSFFEPLYNIYAAPSLSHLFKEGVQLLQYLLLTCVPITGLLSASMCYTDQERERILFEKAYVVLGALLVISLLQGYHAILGFCWLNWYLWTVSWGLWWPKRPKGFEKEILFYDGTCSFCQACCRLIYAEERSIVKLEFSSSLKEREEAFLRAKNIDERSKQELKIPQALVLITDEGHFIYGSDAVFALMRRMGGVWKALSYIRFLIPRACWQWGYKQVASMRRKIPFFKQSCKKCSRD